MLVFSFWMYFTHILPTPIPVVGTATSDSISSAVMSGDAGPSLVKDTLAHRDNESALVAKRIRKRRFRDLTDSMKKQKFQSPPKIVLFCNDVNFAKDLPSCFGTRQAIPYISFESSPLIPPPKV